MFLFSEFVQDAPLYSPCEVYMCLCMHTHGLHVCLETRIVHFQVAFKGCGWSLTHSCIEFLTSERRLSRVCLYLYRCIVTDLCVTHIFFSSWLIIFLSKFPNDLEQKKILSWDSRTEGASGGMGSGMHLPHSLQGFEKPRVFL